MIGSWGAKRSTVVIDASRSSCPALSALHTLTSRAPHDAQGSIRARAAASGSAASFPCWSALGRSSAPESAGDASGAPPSSWSRTCAAASISAAR